MFASTTFWLLALTFTSSHWPGFLGAGSGPREAQQLPLEWGPTQGVTWSVSLPGHGQSSPVTWGSRVFVTSVDGTNKETYYTVCIDVETGSEIWRQRLANSVPVRNSYYVSRAAPTPVVDDERVVVLFESGDCVAYDHDGETLWSRPLSKDLGPFAAEFGLGASLAATEQAVFALLEHDGPSCLLAMDKSTGKTIWKTERPSGRSWSSPAIVQIGGEPHVVVSSGGSVSGYSATTGASLWTFDDLGGNTGCTPIDCGEGRFLVGASPGRNGENAGSAADSNCMIQVIAGDDGFKVTKKWIAEGATPTWASPIVHEGLAYWINRSGVVSCFDAETGEKVYSERTKQSCWATPYGVGDRVYFFGKDGVVTVLAAGREFSVLAENNCWDAATLPAETPLPEEDTEERRRGVAMFSQPTLYGTAVLADRFLFRVGHVLLCVQKP